MDSISERNQKFISEGLNLLTSLSDLKECEYEVFKMLRLLNEGTIIDQAELLRIMDTAEYFKVKTNDIVSTIILHISKVQYEHEDIKDKLTAVNKNAHIGKVTIPTNIVTSNTIPDFNIDIINLGLNGINKDNDEIYLKLYYPDLTEFSEKIIGFDKSICNIMDTSTVTVSGMKSPGRNYQYNLIIQVREKDTGLVFGKLEIRGINISKEVELIHVIQETYERIQD